VCTTIFKYQRKARAHRQCVLTVIKSSDYPKGAKRVCYFCGRKFNRLSHLSDHLSCRHTFEKPFRCNFCFAEFYHSCDLQNHVALKHTKELSYKCYYCNFRGTTARQILLHSKKLHKTQTLEASQTFQCHVCKATCDTISTLWEHMKLHRHERPFVCYFCVKAYHRKSILNTHMKKCHLRELVYV